MPDDLSPRSTPSATPAALDDGWSLRLCERIAAWRYEDLPAPVIATSKALILDVLAAIGGAAQAPGVPELNARLARWEQAGSATGLIGMRRYSPPTAALANGAAAHALDFDDQHDPARVHTSCVVLPTLLALAQDSAPVSGRDFVLAFAIGAELHARLGLACYNLLGHGWHPTMVLGTVAASIAGGRMLGLDAARIANGLGFAYHQASGSAQSMRDGVLSKRIGAGFAARAAVLGTALGADGLTGTRRTFEGNAGLFTLYAADEVRLELLTDGLGEHWRVPEYSFKPFPCCRCNHTAIGLGIGLHRRGIRPQDVAAIRIGMGEVNFMTVGTPYDPARNDVVHAQFNAAYGFARALIDGRVVPDSYRRDVISAPEIAALTRITEVVTDPTIDPTAIEPARIELRMHSGEIIRVASDTIEGSPQQPMTAEAMRAKVRSCLAFGLNAPESMADRLSEAVDRLDQAGDAAAALCAAFPR
jgi:2-methylcitrate dehydratase PrpD